MVSGAYTRALCFMEKLTDYLKVDYELAGIDTEETQVRLKTRMGRTDKNHFCLEQRKNLKHYKLEIYAEIRSLNPLDSPEDRDWSVHSWSNGIQRTLPFYMSRETKPSNEEMFSFVYNECRAAMYSLYNPQHRNYTYYSFTDKGEIDLDDVYVYLRLRGENFSNTSASEFIRDYWFWHECLYQTQKWFHYLMGDILNKTNYDYWEFPVGWNLLEFLPPSEYPSELIQRIRKECTR